MLVEVDNVRQIKNDGFRRWFRSINMDLYVWYPQQNEKDILGFQLCYKLGNEEKALTWKKELGFIHNTVDDGEVPGSIKETPILVQDGVFYPKKTLDDFLSQAKEMDVEVKNFVQEKIITLLGN
jgi:hypothetical protein